jgi:ATP-dependent DNA helicase RecQ
MALLRQLLVAKYIRKDIETYGVIKLTQKGTDFIESPTSFMMTEDHSFKQANDDVVVLENKGSGIIADAGLFKLLKAELKATADKLSLPPYVIFQEPSLEDMALKYPITIEELSNVHGVGEGKAKKYGTNFVALIKKYVDQNEIERPDDLVVKSTGSNSANKLYIIQNVDRKLPLTDIADSKGLPMEELIKQMEAIVYSGTKLDISYWVDEILDDDQQEEIHDYFLESETDKIDDAMQEFDGEYDDEELRVYRIKFISEVAN